MFGSVMVEHGAEPAPEGWETGQDAVQVQWWDMRNLETNLCSGGGGRGKRKWCFEWRSQEMSGRGSSGLQSTAGFRSWTRLFVASNQQKLRCKRIEAFKLSLYRNGCFKCASRCIYWVRLLLCSGRQLSKHPILL